MYQEVIRAREKYPVLQEALGTEGWHGLQF